MRLWTLHPKYLDARGLVALWRESLLAQAVLAGATRGYRHHPQLQRFQNARRPLGAIAEYLRGVHAESTVRGYSFDVGKIRPARFETRLSATRGQLEYEWQHLLSKLRVRDRGRFESLQSVARPVSHPLFRVHAGPVATWEAKP